MEGFLAYGNGSAATTLTTFISTFSKSSQPISPKVLPSRHTTSEQSTGTLPSGRPCGTGVLPFAIETDHDERKAPMAATFIHTCYRILDPARSEDFYVNKLGMLFRKRKVA